jgi:predicted membrane protein
MQYAWYDLLGSIGVGLIILTYVALQLEKIRSEQLLYSVLNAIGAGLIVFSLLFSFNFSAFVVEFFWVLISLYGIGKYFMKGKKEKGEKVKK